MANSNRVNVIDTDDVSWPSNRKVSTSSRMSLSVIWSGFSSRRFRSMSKNDFFCVFPKAHDRVIVFNHVRCIFNNSLHIMRQRESYTVLRTYRIFFQAVRVDFSSVSTTFVCFLSPNQNMYQRVIIIKCTVKIVHIK